MEERHLIVDNGSSVRTWSHAELVGLPGGLADVHRATGYPGSAVPVGAFLSTDLGWVTVSSSDGSYRASIPATQLLADGLLLLASNESPLPTVEGGPFRLIVADGDTLCWNVKDVASFTATAEREPDSVPKDPPH